MRIKLRILLATAFLFLTATSFGQVLTSAQVDSVVNKTLKAFDVPGIAVAIVKDGKVIHAKGYGVRSIKTGLPVDEHTLFGVASNTKAFTAAALGILVDEKKITWDTKVVSVIPDFQLYDPYVTREFTIKDLLTHRSGLGLGAGDLMIWPDSSKVTKAELIHNLRYLKPVSAFRTKYDYDNLLYIVAGEVVTRVSGMPYEDFIESRLIKPVGMIETAASWYRLKDKSNVIDGHAPYEGKLLPVGLSFTEIANAAGGIYSNVLDMSKWVIAQINGGRYGDNLDKRLYSAAVQRELWTPQTIINGGSPYNTHFSAYGLGWFLSDVNGYFQATHTGGLSGIVTQVTILPELKLGIIVLTNQQSGAAFNAITNTIKDGYFNIKGQDRIKQYNEARLAQEKQAKATVDKVWADIAQQQTATAPNSKPVEGVYSDKWFGEVAISKVNGKLHFEAAKSPKLRGDMSFFKDDTYIVRWYDRSLDADAFVRFKKDKSGKITGMTMEAISPMTDFSFDFQDLEFIRAAKK